MLKSYNFDEVLDRRNTDSYKWERYANTDITAAWLADMDFRSPPAVLHALDAVTNMGVFAYPQVPIELIEVVIERLRLRHNWHIKSEWIVWLPGLVPGLYATCRAVGELSDAVMMPTPVYGPFMGATASAQREIQKVPLILENNRWTFDFDTIRQQIKANTRLFLLCNPHNPGGTVFNKTELQELSNICLEYNIIVCSDEIHCDLILNPALKHISIATLNPAIEQQSITLLAPSKTFNIAGLGCSFAVIPNEDIRTSFKRATEGIMPAPTHYAYQAAIAAYKHSADWLRDLLVYLKGNHDFLHQEINKMPGLSMYPLEATYLAWIDTRKSFIAKQPQQAFEKVGVGLADGKVYGGDGFVRMAFAMPRPVLEQTIERMWKFFD